MPDAGNHERFAQRIFIVLIILHLQLDVGVEIFPLPHSDVVDSRVAGSSPLRLLTASQRVPEPGWGTPWETIEWRSG